MHTSRTAHEVEASPGIVRREPGCAAVDASDLGLPPGEFPKHLRIVSDGVVSNWYKVGPSVDGGESPYVLYVASVLSGNTRTLKVFKD